MSTSRNWWIGAVVVLLTVALLVPIAMRRVGSPEASAVAVAEVGSSTQVAAELTPRPAPVRQDASRPGYIAERPLQVDPPEGVTLQVVPKTFQEKQARVELSPNAQESAVKYETNFVPRKKKPNSQRDQQIFERRERLRQEAADDATSVALTPTGKLDDPQRAPRASAVESFSGAVLTFESFDVFDSGAIPPDPHGAAGPNHVVNVVNSNIAFFDKAGNLDSSATLFSFFSPLANTGTFDPKVLWDSIDERFVVITLEAFSSGPSVFSQILVAVSDDADPNGTWYATEIDALATIGGESTFADFPGLAVDEEAIYITANQFGISSGGFQNSRVYIVEKGVGVGGLYDGGPATQSGVTVPLPDPPNDSAFFNFTFQPAHILEDTAPAGVGTYFVTYNGIAAGSNEAISFTTLTDPLGTPTFTQEFVELGNVENSAAGLPNATQPGGVTAFDSGGRGVIDVVWRDDEVWAVTTMLPNVAPDAGQATVHWMQLDTSVFGATTVLSQGDIGGEDLSASTHTFYPSVEVDELGNVAFGFAASSSTLFGGAYFTFRLPADPAGSTQSPLTVRAGNATYVQLDGGGRNRWGDYTGVSLDPSNEGCFWVYNEFVTQANAWSTQWSQFCLGDAVCGDGSVDPPETCDPPGLPAGQPDVCRDSCKFCGDGQLQSEEGEQCDDGNNAPGDGCDPNCIREECGNGILQAGESCEPPGASLGLPAECRSDCTFCGDDSRNGTNQLVLNGGFESGDFSGWMRSFTGSGSFLISVPGDDLPQSNNPTAANLAGGTSYAVSDESGPGTHVLTQPFFVPSNAGVELSFQMFANNWNSVAAGTPNTPGTFVDPAGLDETTPDPNQHARVDLLVSGTDPFDTSEGSVIRNFFLGADPLSPPENPYISYTFDITDDVVAGQNYLLRFADVGNQFFFNLGVDNVAIRVDVNTETCDDGNNSPGDGCTSTCRTCGSLNQDLYGQDILGLDEDTFGWGLPADIDFVQGDLAQVATYATFAQGSETFVTTLSVPDSLAPGEGVYVIVRTDCPSATWSSGGDSECDPSSVCPPGGRDGNLPEINP